LSTPNRWSLTPEPHVNVFGVGFLPKTWRSRYVWLVQKTGYANVSLLNWFEIRRAVEKRFGMLREPQHERKFLNHLGLPFVRPEPVEGLRMSFSTVCRHLILQSPFRRWRIIAPSLLRNTPRAYRDYTYRQLADQCALVMLSSRTALEHFAAFAPKHAHKGRVVSFPSLLAFEHLQENVFETQQKFRIPAKFALVANQFWRHKNHELVIEAVRQLRHRGIRVSVVITGVPMDNRDPNNETTSRILQSVASTGLLQQVVVLGMVSEPDLANLMRIAVILIQPSRFEGWSIVIQECKAIGRPMICSDIPAHREQAPDALGFFHLTGRIGWPTCWLQIGPLWNRVLIKWPRMPPLPQSGSLVGNMVSLC
jgi:glycosyltransferase involved in cell wall biosynthesis